jgi:hypothetical protein
MEFGSICPIHSGRPPDHTIPFEVSQLCFRLAHIRCVIREICDIKNLPVPCAALKRTKSYNACEAVSRFSARCNSGKGKGKQTDVIIIPLDKEHADLFEVLELSAEALLQIEDNFTHFLQHIVVKVHQAAAKSSTHAPATATCARVVIDYMTNQPLMYHHETQQQHFGKIHISVFSASALVNSVPTPFEFTSHMLPATFNVVANAGSLPTKWHMPTR